MASQTCFDQWPRGGREPSPSDPLRRALLRVGALGGVVLCSPLKVSLAGVGAPDGAQGDPDLANLLRSPTPAGDRVRITVPASVEDGAVVPVSVESSLARTQEIAILVDKNPIALAARFRIPEGTEAFVSTRIKVAESGPIRALVTASGRLYTASAQTQITMGGCR